MSGPGAGLPAVPGARSPGAGGAGRERGVGRGGGLRGWGCSARRARASAHPPWHQTSLEGVVRFQPRGGDLGKISGQPAGERGGAPATRGSPAPALEAKAEAMRREGRAVSG